MDQIDSGVLGDCGETGDSGHHLEVDATSYARRGLVGDSIVQNGSPLTRRTTRVPVEACLSTILARAEGSVDRASVSRRDHLGTLGKRDGRMSQDLSLPIIVQDHRTRVGESGNGAQRQ